MRIKVECCATHACMFQKNIYIKETKEVDIRIILLIEWDAPGFGPLAFVRTLHHLNCDLISAF